MRKVIFTTLAFLLSFLSNGQVEALPTSEVKMNRQSIANTPFPFDVPFYIIGDAPDNCIRIDYKYKIREEKWWMNFKGGDIVADTWTKDGGKFALFCPGLHPNQLYRFDFDIYKNLDITPAVKAELKKAISDRLIQFVSDNRDGYHTASLAVLDSSLAGIFGDKLKTECKLGNLRSKCNPSVSYPTNIKSNPLLAFKFNQFNVHSLDIDQARSNLFGKGKDADLLASEIKLIAPNLVKDIDWVLTGKANFNTISKEYLGLSITPSSTDFKSYTLLDGLNILRKLLVPPRQMEDFLSGKLKISNKNLVNTAEVDFESLHFFFSLVEFLAEGAVKDSTNSRKFRELDSLVNASAYTSYKEEIERLNRSKARLAELVETFPDFSAEIILADALSVQTISDADVTTEKSPYISLDGGISYSTSFQSIKTYSCINFYLAPVNKKAKMKDFTAWYKFKKSFCFTVGLSNLFGSRPSNSFSVLGDDSKQDLLVGVGYRTGRIVKINAHWLPFKTTNTNILAPDRDLKVDFAISLGADVNILKAFGNIGKVLKLTD